MEQRKLLRTGSAELTEPCLDRAYLAGRLGSLAAAGRIPVRRSSQSIVAARGDHDLNPDMFDPSRELRQAAVLVPIVLHAPVPSVLLTRRAEHLPDHPGQISFPGGRIEAADRDPHHTALREAEEEVGLLASQVEIVGELDTYVVRTGYEVVPLVGLVEPPIDPRPQPDEVAEIFEVPLDFFLATGSRQTHSRMFQGRERFFYAYPYRDYYIWGATAGMLSNLAEILTAPGPDEGGR